MFLQPVQQHRTVNIVNQSSDVHNEATYSRDLSVLQQRMKQPCRLSVEATAVMRGNARRHICPECNDVRVTDVKQDSLGVFVESKIHLKLLEIEN